MTDAVKRYVAYGRFSTDMQNDKSAADQIASCDERAKAFPGWVKVGEYADEGLTGDATQKRLGLQALLRDASAGKFDVLMVESVDRFSRRPSEGHYVHEKLQFHDAQVFSLVDNDFITDMHMALRMYESSQYLKKLKHNVKRGQIGALKRGALVGSIPYGYVAVRGADVPRGIRAINEEEAKIVRRLFAEFATGMSPVEIVRRLNEEGVSSPDGKKWRPSTLFGHAGRSGGILANPHYRGVYRWGITQARRNPDTGAIEQRLSDPAGITEVPLPAELRIVDDTVWNEVQARILAQRRIPLPRRKRPKHTMSGLLFCGICGHSYIVTCSKRLGCSGRVDHGTCSNRRRVDRAELEAAILSLLSDSLLNEALVDSYIKTYRAEHRRLCGQINSDAAVLRKQITRSEQELGRLIGLVASDQVQESARASILVAIESRTNELESRRKELADSRLSELPDYSAKNIVLRLKAQLADIGEAIAGEDVDSARARESVRSLIDRIEIAPSGEDDGRGCGPVSVTLEGRISAILENSPDRVVQSASGTASQLNHLKWRASIVIENSNKTRKTRAPTNSDLVLDFLQTTNCPTSVEDLIRHLIRSNGLDCLKHTVRMAKARVQRALDHFQRVGIVVSISVPGWRKYLWALKEREHEFWPEASHPPGNFSDTKTVLEVLTRTVSLVSVAEIAAQVALAMGERPRSKRTRYLAARVRACLHFHRRQGTVLQVVYERTQRQRWLLASRSEQLLPGVRIPPDGRIVYNPNVLTILGSATGPLTAAEIAKAAMLLTGDMPTEQNTYLSIARVRANLRRYKEEGCVKAVRANGNQLAWQLAQNQSKLGIGQDCAGYGSPSS